MTHELDRRNLPESLASDPNIVDALNKLDRMFDEDERAVYEIRAQARADFGSKLDTAMEKGIRRGREEGRKEGLEEGRREERLALAKELLCSGMPLEQICAITKLPPEDLE